MKDLIGKIGQVCENHVEKIVLVLVGAVCVWLFFTRVIFSPNGMAIDRTNKPLAPSQIDRRIYEQKAQDLLAKLRDQKKSGAAKPYARKLDGPIDAKDQVIAGVISRPLAKGFLGLFESPLSFLDAGSVPTKPAARPLDQQYADRKYRLPLIPDVTDVAVSHVRAAAYVPLQELTAQMTYDKAPVEANDIDLVTVECRADVAEVYRRYQASFAGVDVQKEEWRDPCLAKPVFAGVQLQRQELQEDGTWSDWRPVPRSRVEANRDQFQMIERVADLPTGGLNLRLMQFNHDVVAMGLLQPESYQIASAEEDWFPPTYYTKFKDLQRRADAEKKRDEKEKDRKQNDQRGGIAGGANPRGGLQQGAGMYGGGMNQGPGGGRGAPGQARRGNVGGMGGDPMYGGARGARGARGPAGGAYGPGGDPMMAGRGGRGARPGAGGDAYAAAYGGGYGPGDMTMRRRSTTNEVYWDFAKEIITYREDLSKRDKPLLVWAFDDTAEPGKTYHYRARLGVFNPVAGTNQLVERDLNKKDQVILWSPFSQVTKPVEIQKMVYLFAKNVQDKTSTATVEVARYAQGYWHTQDFQVKPGEAIGKVMEPKKDDDKDKEKTRRARMMMAGGGAYAYPPGAQDRLTGPRGGPALGPGPMPGMAGAMPAYMPGGLDPQNAPKDVDYRTGKVLVDLVPVNDWGSAPNLRPRLYSDMLYTGDGTRIEHMPVNNSNWAKDVALTYQYIQAEKRKEPQPFRAFNKSGFRGRNMMGRPGEGGAYDEGGGYDDSGAYGGYGAYEGGGGAYP